MKIEKIFTQIIDPPSGEVEKPLNQGRAWEGGTGAGLPYCIVGVWIIIHSVTCTSIITECLVQIIIHSEGKELSRDGDPSVIVIRTVNYIKIKKEALKLR